LAACQTWHANQFSGKVFNLRHKDKSLQEAFWPGLGFVALEPVISADSSKLWATGKTLRCDNDDVKSIRDLFENVPICQCLQGFHFAYSRPFLPDLGSSAENWWKNFSFCAAMPVFTGISGRLNVFGAPASTANAPYSALLAEK
jgi:hypothetical protein